MDKITNRRGVSKRLLAGDGEGKVHARVIVGPGGVTDKNKGEKWSLAGHAPRYMAISVTWTVPEVSGDRLDLWLQPLTGSGASEKLELHPLTIDGTPVVDLYVFHTPQSEIVSRLPPQQGNSPDPGHEASHFKSFYTFFPHPPVPIYEGVAAAEPGSTLNGRDMMEESAQRSSVHFSGESHNREGGTSVGDLPTRGVAPPCMSATATLEP
jgi:hypothetical protein